MKRIPVESSSIVSVGYDADHATLEVEFEGNRVYEYLDVPASVYEALLEADSIGRFVNERVKGVFDYRPV
jgi:hypothetical protein